jgi:hypothetical protein
MQTVSRLRPWSLSGTLQRRCVGSASPAAKGTGLAAAASLKPGPSSAAASPSPSTASHVKAQAQSAFRLRQSPFNMGGKKGLHSHLLTEHPLTLKAQREEGAFRQRVLAERGEYDAEARKAAEELKATIEATPEGQRMNETKWILAVGLGGYIFGHYLAYNLFYTAEVRLPYDPVRGFVEDLSLKRRQWDEQDSQMRQQMRTALSTGMKRGNRASLLAETH